MSERKLLEDAAYYAERFLERARKEMTARKERPASEVDERHREVNLFEFIEHFLSEECRENEKGGRKSGKDGN